MEYAKPPGSAFGPRRVFTAPVVATPQSSSSASVRSGDGVVETLYNNSSVRIVAFTAGPRNFVFSPGRGRDAPPVEDIEPGSLPSSTPLERTIAVGSFRIYRAPGSVAFLSCGSALQPILPKSQCWCIDEISSKFILQIRRPQYWRIEVPAGKTGDELRQVFDKILQFEKTPCPFKRGFFVELPERPQTPVKKRPWTPVTRTFVSTPPTPVTPSQPRLAAAAAKENEAKSPSVSPELKEVQRSVDESEDGKDEESTPIATFMDRLRPFEKEVAAPKPTETVSNETATPESPNIEDTRPLHPITGSFPSFQSSRCVTAPPQLMLDTMPSLPKDMTEVVVKQQSPTESSASFHSTESWHSPLMPLPPSPPMSNPSSPVKTFPYPHEIPSPAAHQRDISDATITPITGDWVLSPTGADIVSLDGSSESSSVYEDALKSPPESLEPASDPIEEQMSRPQQVPAESAPLTPSDTCSTTSLRVSTPPATTSTALIQRPPFRHRATTSRTSLRGISPLPPAATLFTPHRQPASRYASSRRATTRMDVVRRIPRAILSKTCEILLSPPSHLLTLMLTVAAKISAGEWRGLVFGRGEGGEEVKVGWDWSEDEAESHRGRANDEDDDEEDDDYFSQRSRSASVASRASRGESPCLRNRLLRARSGSTRGEYAVTTGYADSGPDDVLDFTSRRWEVD